MDWFTSDLHINHITCLRHRPFDSMEAMNSTIMDAFDCVGRGDRVFMLGDLSWDESSIRELFERLLKKKAILFWIMGNHDKELFKKIEYPNLFKYQTLLVRGWGDYQPLFLSHYPQLIYDKSHNGAYQLHGHGHLDTIDVPILQNIDFGKRLNVNIEFHGFKLWSRDEVEEYMKSKPVNLDYVLLHGTPEEQAKVKDALLEIRAITDRLNKEIANGNN